MKNIPSKETNAVEDYISSLDDEQSVVDTRVLIDMMQCISGREPKLWYKGTIGFDTYHYKYESGREGDCQTIGFYPRKGKLTFYLMDGTVRHSDLLARLGKHTTSTACLYIKRLADIDVAILEQIISDSYTYIKSQDGQMHRAIQ